MVAPDQQEGEVVSVTSPQRMLEGHMIKALLDRGKIAAAVRLASREPAPTRRSYLVVRRRP